MIPKFSVLATALVATANTAASLATTSHSPTSVTTTMTITSSALSRPTWFNVIARDSGTEYDGKTLMGTDQGFVNMTFAKIPPDYYPSSNIYLSGTNKSPHLKSQNGFQIWAGYHGSDNDPSTDDNTQAWLSFGSSDFVLYGYKLALCSAVPKSTGKFHLACSIKASDGKVNYRKAMINEDGELSLLPLGSALPEGYSFVKLEILPLPGSAPTSVPPCCP